ncbi:MAG: hypothetical protein ACRES9_10105 [Gammaproteobacteria bacterium]
MNIKVGPQGRRAAIGVFAVLICATVTVGFSSNAYAVCKHPNAVSGPSPNLICGGPGNPPPPYPLSGTVHNASVTGTVVPSNKTITPNLTFQSGPTNAVTGSINTEANTFEVWLPHTYQKFHLYKQDGTLYYSLYISTQSEFAPSGDNGTFIFNATNGDLVSGNSTAL